jgi:N-acetylmuramoyl-L-alanine amidase
LRVIMRRLFLLIILPFLAACATGPKVDTTYTSQGQDSRVLFLVLHYTVGNFESSVKMLTQGPVSSHYLVSDGRDGKPATIYRLVDENMRAWHAGPSVWNNHAGLNSSSIGIEIVNKGWIDTPNGRVFEPFPDEQMDRVLEISRDIIKRYNIKPDRVIAHSDIAPGRKQDPGPLFPWKRFADEGLVVWPKDDMVAFYRTAFTQQLPPVQWFQDRLAKHGFNWNVPRHGDLDEATRNVISSFQMKYRPANYDGQPDVETAALLAALTESKS